MFGFTRDRCKRSLPKPPTPLRGVRGARAAIKAHFDKLRAEALNLPAKQRKARLAELKEREKQEFTNRDLGLP
ncbi:MAG: hypothetical protein KatS3mg082_3167 [Nitrospiraceae bacterium]|nr:MAG: hypothetical protein KatS3mg082_3167 [Nitrospiraceae bacterium]